MTKQPKSLAPLLIAPARGVLFEARPMKKQTPKANPVVAFKPLSELFKKHPTDYEGDPSFIQFWNAYPRRQAKYEAFKEWQRISPSCELQRQIMGSLEKWKKSRQWQADNGAYIPFPGKWLGKQRWLDEPDIQMQAQTAIHDDYKDYLNSPEWAVVRRIAMAFFKHKCQLCGSVDGLQVHHKDYSHRGYETLEDVVVLCAECHKKYHKTTQAGGF
jgi:5-methylcytosine-specific restriction endonuclease McrA